MRQTAGWVSRSFNTRRVLRRDFTRGYCSKRLGTASHSAKRLVRVFLLTHVKQRGAYLIFDLEGGVGVSGFETGNEEKYTKLVENFNP